MGFTPDRLLSNRSIELFALIIVAVNGCTNHSDIDSYQSQRMPAKTIEQVRQDHTDEWMSIAGVVGTAIGQTQGKPCILILTSANQEQIKKSIPESVENYPVIVQYVGKIESR